MKTLLQQELLKVDEVAEIMRVDPSFVYGLLRSTRAGEANAIPAYRLIRGKRSVWRIPTKEFLEWLRR